jgi:hypothetical protein
MEPSFEWTVEATPGRDEVVLAKGDATSDEVERLRRLYDRFNAHDIETVLAAMHEDVMWANGTGRRARSRTRPGA